MRGCGKGNDEAVLANAWTGELMARQPQLKPLDDYLRPQRHHIDLDDADALGAGLDRLVAIHHAAAPDDQHKLED